MPVAAVAIPEPDVSEPISPELVMVDPELRRALQEEELRRPVPLHLVAVPPLPVQSRLVPAGSTTAPAHVRAPAAPLPPAETPQGPGARGLGWRNRFARVVLPLSLALNVILIGFAWSDATVPLPSSAAPAGPPEAQTLPRKVVGKVPATPASPRPKGTSTKSASPRRTVPKQRGAVASAAARGAVERKLLTLVVRSPAGKLPPALIDSKTGLANNGLQAVCRSSDPRSFLCVIQPARHKPGEGLYARYRLKRNGTGGTVTWDRYRSG